MGVAPGSPVSAANTNQAFWDSGNDDTAVGKYTVANTDMASGPTILNIQALMNANRIATGASESDFTLAVTYTGATPNVLIDGNSHKQALISLANKFDPSTGHTHSGTAGDGPNIPFTSISGSGIGVLRGLSIFDGAVGSILFEIPALDCQGYQFLYGLNRPGITGFNGRSGIFTCSYNRAASGVGYVDEFNPSLGNAGNEDCGVGFFADWNVAGDTLRCGYFSTTVGATGMISGQVFSFYNTPATPFSTGR